MNSAPTARTEITDGPASLIISMATVIGTPHGNKAARVLASVDAIYINRHIVTVNPHKLASPYPLDTHLTETRLVWNALSLYSLAWL